VRLGDDEVEGEREKEETNEPVDVDNPHPWAAAPWSPTSMGVSCPTDDFSINGKKAVTASTCEAAPTHDLGTRSRPARTFTGDE
jgi:hypothetical protein